MCRAALCRSLREHARRRRQLKRAVLARFRAKRGDVGSAIHGLLRAAFCVSALCTAACSPNVRFFQVVPGKQVQQKIDETIAPLISSYFPKLKIEPSRCEPIIILSLGITGSCTLSVNNVPLQIRVASADPPYAFQVDFGGAFFFDMPTVEKAVESFLIAQYQVTAVANCGSPRERLLQTGTSWVCTIEGSPNVRSVKVEAASNGQVLVHKVPGLKIKSLIPMELLTGHKQGKVTILRGADVRTFYMQMMASSPVSYPQETVIACPSHIDLTGNKRGVCTATIPNLKTPQSIGVWIDDAASLRVKPINALIDRGRVQKTAQDELNKMLTDNGAAADAVVACEKGFVVVEMPGTFYCDVMAEGRQFKLTVAVDDQGKVNFSIPRDNGP